MSLSTSISSADSRPAGSPAAGAPDGKHPENRFAPRASMGKTVEKATFGIIRFMTYLILLAAAAIFLQIGYKGAQTVFTTQAPFINIPFLTESPSTLHVFEWQGKKMELSDQQFREFKEQHAVTDLPSTTYAYSAGGIFPCIVGTVLLVVGSMSIALTLSIFSAIYLNEYSRGGWMINLIRLAIMNLAGVPSIVFGLFGVGLFVIFLGWNVSLLAGCFTLAFMVLPVVIIAAEEALKTVPQGFREASLALGATKWQAIRTSVLPYALPGILTSSILGIARVAGETAPIMFTAAYVMRDELPWQVSRVFDFFFQGVMALPYHIYVVSSKIPQNEYTERVQYGTAFIFLAVVMGIALGSVLFRIRLRKNLKW